MLGERLAKLRKEKGNTQEEIAKYLGVTRPAYTAYERNTRTPDYELLKKIADYYNVSTDYLLGHETKDIDSMTEEEIDEEIKEIMREVNVWYKDEPKDKKEKLIMLRKIIKTFIED